MKTFIHEVQKSKKLFYCIINGRKEAFLLSNRLAKIFLPILKKGIMIDFEVKEKVLKKNLEVYPVLYFNQVIQLNPYTVLYDLNDLRKEMKRVLSQYKYFLFLDLEMSMPGYRPQKFIPEIIQVGYILADYSGEVILDKGYYVLPENESAINKRTIKFLKLDEQIYFGHARSYEYFYEDLKKVITTYKPQCVVWGKNDIQALAASYQIHKVKPLIRDKQFIDLLKLHKDYYNLQDDLGLFKAYQTYYGHDISQDHDARTDAVITKDVFDAFVKTMNEL
jgi:sporulation inhibitor KapD